MSKPIQYDSLLVRALAAELHARYGGQHVRWIRFDPDARTLRIRIGRNTLVWDLGPAGGLTESAEKAQPAGTQLPRSARLAAVFARPDDRILEWRIEADDDDARRRYHLWVELLPNRRGAALTTEDHRLVSGFGVSSANSLYRPPQHQPRRGAEPPIGATDFLALLQAAQPADRERVLLAELAWISPINVMAVLGSAAKTSDENALTAAWQRYSELVDPARTSPVLLHPASAPQPYPVPLPGEPSQGFPDLLSAFTAASQGGETPPDRAGVLAALERRRQSAESKAERMRREMAGAAEEAARHRRMADLLLAHVAEVRRGLGEVTLSGWDGEPVRIELDSSQDGAGNANRLYAAARKRDRAAARLPELIEQAAAEASRLAETIARLEREEITPEAAAALLPPAGRSSVRPDGRPARALPYKRYRTSSGLEVRVGKGAKANDELTLRHSSPDDIWMHARGAAGAHVVLRWGRRDENPPAADITEAAVLAALNSRARTSGAVAVDWTRRKHVRKPRKAKPGTVLMDQARTVFVEPDAAVEQRLREPG